MIKKPIIAVDVDLTVVDSLTPWLKWFTDETGLVVKNEEGLYDLVPEMVRLVKESGMDHFDPFSYWVRNDLYRAMSPIPGSVETLSRLHDMGCPIIFVSLCEPEHIRSKVGFLRRNFRFDHGFVDTAHKHFVKYDVLVDDREKHILEGTLHNPESMHLLFTQIARQTVKYNNQFTAVSNWDEVESIVIGLLK